MGHRFSNTHLGWDLALGVGLCSFNRLPRGTNMSEDITGALRSRIEMRLRRTCSQRQAEAVVRAAQALQYYVGEYEESYLHTVNRDGWKVNPPWLSRLEACLRLAASEGECKDHWCHVEPNSKEALLDMAIGSLCCASLKEAPEKDAEHSA